MCTMKNPLLHTELLFTLLYQGMSRGLDVAGLRFCFSNNDSVFDDGGSDRSHSVDGPSLAIAFRGTSAIQVLQDIIGPEDPSLAALTDPTSISAVFKERSRVLSYVHSHFWVGVELAKWFGGRACPESGSILGVSDAITRSERRKRQRVRFSESESEDTLHMSAPVQPSTSLPDVVSFTPLVSNIPSLTAYSYSSILFISSPLVHPLYYSTVLQSIGTCGFDVIGIKRLRLNLKRAQALRLPPDTSSYFIPSSGPSSPEVNTNPPSFMVAGKKTAKQEVSTGSNPPLPSIILILGRENAVSHINHLIHTTFTDLKTAYHDDKSTDIDSSLFDLPNAFFHGLAYSDDYLKVLGSFSSTPSQGSVETCCSEGLIKEQVKEEIGVLSVMGSHSLDNCITLMRNIYTQHNGSEGPVELVGLKLVPELSRFHAKHIPPSGTLVYQDAVDHITGKVTLLLVYRGINVNKRLTAVVTANKKHKSTGLRHSSEDFECFCTVDVANGFEMASMFFVDKELFIDPDSWTLSEYVPLSWAHDPDMLFSMTVTPEPLVSVFTISLTHIR